MKQVSQKNPLFENVKTDSLLKLLEDCLSRIKDGNDSDHYIYVQHQIMKAKEIQVELSVRFMQLESAK